MPQHKSQTTSDALAHLPTELYSDIVQYTRIADRATLYALLFVSHAFNNAAAGKLYYNPWVTCQGEREIFVLALKAIATCPHNALLVRELYVGEVFLSRGMADEQAASLAEDVKVALHHVYPSAHNLNSLTLSQVGAEGLYPIIEHVNFQLETLDICGQRMGSTTQYWASFLSDQHEIKELSLSLQPLFNRDVQTSLPISFLPKLVTLCCSRNDAAYLCPRRSISHLTLLGSRIHPEIPPVAQIRCSTLKSLHCMITGSRLTLENIVGCEDSLEYFEVFLGVVVESKTVSLLIFR